MILFFNYLIPFGNKKRKKIRVDDNKFHTYMQIVSFCEMKKKKKHMYIKKKLQYAHTYIN